MLSARHRAAASVDRFFQFSLLGLVASAFCALAGTGRLDRPSLAFLIAGLLWRACMTADFAFTRVSVPQNLIAFIAVAYLVFYPIDYYFVSRDFFLATAHGVCFLGVTRILSAKSDRDYLYTGAMAFVALLGAAALSTQVTFFLWLLLAIVFALAALTSAEIRRGFRRNNRAAPVTNATTGIGTGWALALLVACSACGILVMTIGLFLIVPRAAHAAALSFPGGSRLTGFTNSIHLGGFGSIAKDDRAILHVHSYAKNLPPNLKWRGTALSVFDGRRWSEPPLTSNEIGVAGGTVVVADRLQRSRLDGSRMIYRVDVASSDTGTLFIAGIPEFLNVDAPRLAHTQEDSYRALPALGDPLSYEVSAQTGDPLPYPLSKPDRSRYLKLPVVDRRIPELGRKWSGEGTDYERARRLEQHLHSDFVYSLDTGSRATADPLADFLFTTKRGYCEYFASAMAVLLRTQGIPARVAVGLQSGYFNEVSGTWVLRASDAHAWVEGWIEGRGWVTFDPTPPAIESVSGSWLRRMNMYLDAADTAWQQWVLAYSPGQQAVIAFGFQHRMRSFGSDAPGTPPSGAFLQTFLWPGLYLAGFVLLAVALRIWGWRFLQQMVSRSRLRRIRQGGTVADTADDARLVYERMLESMARRGYQKPAWFTPGEFARHLPEPEKASVSAFTAAYNAVRFGGDSSGLTRLAEMVQAIESEPISVR